MSVQDYVSNIIEEAQEPWQDVPPYKAITEALWEAAKLLAHPNGSIGVFCSLDKLPFDYSYFSL